VALLQVVAVRVDDQKGVSRFKTGLKKARESAGRENFSPVRGSVRQRKCPGEDAEKQKGQRHFWGKKKRDACVHSRKSREIGY